MLAYGLMPGKPVRVRWQSPLTVLEVDRIELALEPELAAMVEVEPLIAAVQNAQTES